MTTINKMYDEEVMRAPSEEEQAEEENFIEGGLKAAKEFNSTFMPAAEANKLEVGDEPAPVNAPLQMPQVQQPQATGQVTPQQVQALFPNDPTSAAIAARRQGQV
jgi:hypothetical protein